MSTVRKHQPTGSVDDYTSLPYHLLLVRDGEDKAKPWTAAVEELPGCTSHGKTSDEALGGIEAAMAKWIGIALEEGREIPEPKSAATHSGRLLLRMPKTLHADLTRASEREGVSLNQFITDVLAAAIVWRGRANPGAAGASSPSSPLQAPGAEGLTTERGTASRKRTRNATLITAALVANFLIVGIAGIVAILVLITAWL
ncbi:MAG TPA: type II toxin-antitoxin system HicB family antitoxin [Gaiellaceae bacterium]|nr:type II toxin-antitoxin system HicB family antitoxin [Gaiellaceae bacterium]